MYILQSGGDDKEEDKKSSRGKDLWDKMMEPFDQDKEEVKDEDKEMWKEAFGEAAKEGIIPKVIRSGYAPTDK